MNAQKQHNLIVTNFLNAALSSIQATVPIKSHIEKPKKPTEKFAFGFGVLIGVLGDLKGKLVFTGTSENFSYIGEKMYGMPLEGEMLRSFSGELGNMIAGGISTKMSENNTNILISTPTILSGNVDLYGYKHAIELPVEFESIGFINIFLLLD